MGMTSGQLLRRVEVPLAVSLIAAGIRTATVQVVATATLAALVAGGGLGRFLVDGYGRQDYAMVYAGPCWWRCSVATEVVLGALQRRLTPARGRRRGVDPADPLRPDRTPTGRRRPPAGANMSAIRAIRRFVLPSRPSGWLAWLSGIPRPTRAGSTLAGGTQKADHACGRAPVSPAPGEPRSRRSCSPAGLLATACGGGTSTSSSSSSAPSTSGSTGSGPVSIAAYNFGESDPGECLQGRPGQGRLPGEREVADQPRGRRTCAGEGRPRRGGGLRRDVDRVPQQEGQRGERDAAGLAGCDRR